MKFPFVLRSTLEWVQMLADGYEQMYCQTRDQSNLLQDEARQLRAEIDRLQKRAMELIDAKRTTPGIAAEVFCGFDAEEQADFFNKVAAESQEWGGSGADYQWYQMAKHLNPDGKQVIKQMEANTHV